MKSYTGGFIWSSVEHGRSEEKSYEKEYYLKEDADNVIANLQKEVLQIRKGVTMATCEYILGYRAALRHLIEASDAPGNQLKKMKITAKNTSEWLKLCHEHAFELAEIGRQPRNCISNHKHVNVAFSGNSRNDMPKQHYFIWQISPVKADKLL